MNFPCNSRLGVRRAWPATVFCLFILSVLTEPANAQAIPLIPPSTQTISVKNGGSLSYYVTSSPKVCGGFLKQPLPLYYFDTYSSFVYTSPSGAKTDLTGSVQFMQNTPTSLGSCVRNTPTTISLDGGGYLIQFTPGMESNIGMAVLQTPVGYLNPKYVILGVTYAPPGPASYVQYGTTTFLSTTNSATDSTSAGSTWSTSVSESFGIPGVLKGKITASDSGSYTQQSSSTSSFTLSAQSVNQTKTVGTPNAFNPVNHDYDWVWLWLNPVVILTVNSTSHTVTWDGYGVDLADQNVAVMDIWPVQVGYLNGDFGPLDPGDAQVLARTWAVGYQTWPSGEGPGLTQADFDQILLADPFANSYSSYVVTVPAGSNTTSDGRFTLAGSGSTYATTFDYKQADPGETALTQSLATTYTSTSTQGATDIATTKETFGIDVNLTGGAFLASLSADFKDSQTMTWVHQVSNSITNTTTSSATLSITGPPCAGATFPCNPAYSGVPEFDVYQDNVFGTFMFNGVTP